jgi:hypothetical protein
VSNFWEGIVGRRTTTSFWFAVILTLALSGCGLYTPDMEIGHEPHLTAFVANRIVGHVKCELGRAILNMIDYDKRDEKLNGERRYPWLDDWAGTLTITMTVDESGAVNPGMTWSDPLPHDQLFTLGVGGGASADATRKQQVDYIFNVREDFINNAAFSRTDPDSGSASCGNETGKILIEGDLKIKDWLDSALFPLNIPGFVDRTPPDVLTDDITFVVTFSGNTTPTWKLVKFSVNDNSPFLSVSRARTNEVLIALGPAKPGVKGAGKVRPLPSQAVIDFRNAALINSNRSVLIIRQ